jgi:hypothetical protein
MGEEPRKRWPPEKDGILPGPMPHEEVQEIVYKVHEAFSRGEREAFVALWPEECEYQPALERDIVGEEGIFRGHDGIVVGGKACWTHGDIGSPRYTRLYRG